MNPAFETDAPKCDKCGAEIKNLPKLTPTQVVDGRHPACWLASPGPDRWKIRSRTYAGIAQAMAEQWGALDKQEAA